MSERHRLWDKEQLFFDGDAYFAALIRDLEQARQSVDFETYIFDSDELGDRIVGELSKLAKRGVRVRVLVDGIGSPAFSSRYMSSLENAGVEVKVYHPLPWQFTLLARKDSTLHKILTLFKWINRRNHRKVCVIDGLVAYVGSMNVSRNHLREFVGAQAWQDAGVRLEGQDIRDLTKSFLQAWTDEHVWKRYRSFKIPARDWATRTLIRLNSRWVERRLLQRNLMKRIGRASTQIFITNPYFVPPRRVIKALCWAAGRGVDVKVILPNKSDVFFIPWITTGLYYSLLVAGVKVYEFEPTVLHSKILTIDNWATVGSSNFNHRSLLHDLEVDAVITWPQSKIALAEKFVENISLSTPITVQNWKHRPFLERLIGEFLFLLKYWF